MFLRLYLFVCLAVAAVNGRVAKPEPFFTDKYIDEINSAQSTWKAGPSKFMSWSEESIKRLMSVRPGYFERHKLLPPIGHEIPNDLPDSFDAREQWPNYPTLREIRNVARFPIGVAGAVETMSDRICTYSNGTQNAHLSTQELFECCSCFVPKDVWEYYITHGIITGGNYNSREGCKPDAIPTYLLFFLYFDDIQYPGEQTTPNCTKKCIDDYPIANEQDRHYGLNVYSVDPDPKQIQAEIFKNGPVAATLAIYPEFFQYISGVYRHTSQLYLGDHVVRILGWGEENSIPYWFAANSWNETWGDNGYVKIFRGQNECGIESGILAGAPKLS